MGQEVLDHKSPGGQLEGMLESSQRYKIRKLVAREGRQLGGNGDKRLLSSGPTAWLGAQAWSLTEKSRESFREGGDEISAVTRTKLPRSMHCPALEELAPGPVAAAYAPAPGREAAQLPAAEAPPACDKDGRAQAQRSGERGRGGYGVEGEGWAGRRGPGRDRSGASRGLVGGLMRHSRDDPGNRKGASPMLMGWNLKSHSPCCQEQGQEIWFQPHVGPRGSFNHCRHRRR